MQATAELKKDIKRETKRERDTKRRELKKDIEEKTKRLAELSRKIEDEQRLIGELEAKATGRMGALEVWAPLPEPMPRTRCNK